MASGLTNRLSRYLPVLIAVLFLAAGGTRAETVNEIKIGGTGFGLEAMRILAKAYQQELPQAEIKVFPSLGSSGGIKALLAGELDLAISSRSLRNQEKTQGLRARELFKTPYVFVTNRSVDKHSITTTELEKIYRGEQLSWPDGSRIRLVLRPRTETDTQLTLGMSPGMQEAGEMAMTRRGMIMAVTDQENAEIIEKTPGALGGSTLNQILTEHRAVNVLALNGREPGAPGLQDGSYPLSKSLFLVTGPKTPPAALSFLAFLLSPAADKILAEFGNLVSPALGPDHE